MNRGISVVDSLKCLKPDASNELVFKAQVLGWCVEWVNRFAFLMCTAKHSNSSRLSSLWRTTSWIPQKRGVGSLAGISRYTLTLISNDDLND